MDIPLFAEELAEVSGRARLIARFALFFSAPLNWVSPYTIERMLSRLTRNLPAATKDQALEMRNAVCAVSKRCRSQEGCIRRSLAVVVANVLLRRSVSWCTGFAQEPFRAHAWIELNGEPVGEPKEINLYTKTINVVNEYTTAEHPTTNKNEDNMEFNENDSAEQEKQNASIPPVRARDLFALAKGHTSEFVGVVILGISSALLMLIQPDLVAGILDQASTEFRFDMRVWILVAALILTTIVTSFQYYLLQRIGEGVVFDARKSLIGHLLRLPIREFDLRSVGDLLSRVSGDSSRLRIALIQGTVALTGGIFLIIGAAIGMAFRDLILFLATLATVILAFVGIILMSKMIQRASYNAQKELGQLSGIVERDLHAIRTIRATNATQSEEKRQ